MQVPFATLSSWCYSLGFIALPGQTSPACRRSTRNHDQISAWGNAPNSKANNQGPRNADRRSSKPQVRTDIRQPPKNVSSTMPVSKGKQEPALALQHASTVDQILDVCREHQATLKASQLVPAFHRLAKLLFQPSSKALKDKHLANVLILLWKPILEDSAALTGIHAVTFLHANAMLEIQRISEVERVVDRVKQTESEWIQNRVLVSHIFWAMAVLGMESKISESVLKIMNALPIRYLKSAVAGLGNVSDLKNEIPFRQDDIYLGDKAVKESRETAWMSDKNQNFEYSGKVMAPTPMTKSVLDMEDKLKKLLDVDFDGVLVNYYADGQVGMRYHVDPDTGTIWEPEQAVISVGDTRMFVLRSMKSHEERYEYYVRHSDVIFMFGDCQEKYQHCVKVEKDASFSEPRMSFVFKKKVAKAK